MSSPDPQTSGLHPGQGTEGGGETELGGGRHLDWGVLGEGWRGLQCGGVINRKIVYDKATHKVI